jgi:hypothetical protein
MYYIVVTLLYTIHSFPQLSTRSTAPNLIFLAYQTRRCFYGFIRNKQYGGRVMAKAQIETAEGITIKVEGTPAEIAAVVKEVKGKPKSGPETNGARKHKTKGNRVTVPGLVEELRDEGFFKKAKTLADVKKRLADLGHTYPRTALSGPLRGEVRKRRLRRFKENGKYVYAQ